MIDNEGNTSMTLKPRFVADPTLSQSGVTIGTWHSNWAFDVTKGKNLFEDKRTSAMPLKFISVNAIFFYSYEYIIFALEHIGLL
jgi:hypothetical protein